MTMAIRRMRLNIPTISSVKKIPMRSASIQLNKKNARFDNAKGVPNFNILSSVAIRGV